LQALIVTQDVKLAIDLPILLQETGFSKKGIKIIHQGFLFQREKPDANCYVFIDHQLDKTTGNVFCEHLQVPYKQRIGIGSCSDQFAYCSHHLYHHSPAGEGPQEKIKAILMARLGWPVL
jgi:hypothetical protein